MGSLALSLCHLADGRVDAVCSLKEARSVDIAAAQLLRARMRVRDRALRGSAVRLRRRWISSRVHALPQPVHRELVDALSTSTALGTLDS